MMRHSYRLLLAQCAATPGVHTVLPPWLWPLLGVCVSIHRCSKAIILPAPRAGNKKQTCLLGSSERCLCPKELLWLYSRDVLLLLFLVLLVCSVLPTVCLPGVSTRELSETFPFDFYFVYLFSFLQLALLAAPGQAGTVQGVPHQW